MMIGDSTFALLGNLAKSLKANDTSEATRASKPTAAVATPRGAVKDEYTPSSVTKSSKTSNALDEFIASSATTVEAEETTNETTATEQSSENTKRNEANFQDPFIAGTDITTTIIMDKGNGNFKAITTGDKDLTPEEQKAIDKATYEARRTAFAQQLLANSNPVSAGDILHLTGGATAKTSESETTTTATDSQATTK